ncbi:hypothetical protein DFJ77DRAFT_507934 [Powellomyces hirtus]|nr:hypothetical protein DFJ77DRAFT_507934 [Powellomyces hirtus]
MRVNNETLNLTWVATSARQPWSNVRRPYAYPIASNTSTGSKYSPLEHNNEFYPCEIMSNGVKYNGTCLLGGTVNGASPLPNPQCSPNQQPQGSNTEPDAGNNSQNNMTLPRPNSPPMNVTGPMYRYIQYTYPCATMKNNATHMNSTWMEGHWANGTTNGTCTNGTWTNGYWTNGTFTANNGTYNGTYENGMWVNGTCSEGVANNGTCGSWNTTWVEASCNGTWSNETWVNGTWYNSTWMTWDDSKTRYPPQNCTASFTWSYDFPPTYKNTTHTAGCPLAPGASESASTCEYIYRTPSLYDNTQNGYPTSSYPCMQSVGEWVNDKWTPNARMINTTCTSISDLSMGTTVVSYSYSCPRELATYNDMSMFLRMETKNATCHHRTYTSPGAKNVTSHSFSFSCMKSASTAASAPNPGTCTLPDDELTRITMWSQTAVRAPCVRSATWNNTVVNYNATCTSFLGDNQIKDATLHPYPCNDRQGTILPGDNATTTYWNYDSTCIKQTMPSDFVITTYACPQLVAVTKNGTFSGVTKYAATCTNYANERGDNFTTFTYPCEHVTQDSTGKLTYYPQTCTNYVLKYNGVVQGSAKETQCLQKIYTKDFSGMPTGNETTYDTVCSQVSIMNANENYTYTSYPYPCYATENTPVGSQTVAVRYLKTCINQDYGSAQFDNCYGDVDRTVRGYTGKEYDNYNAWLRAPQEEPMRFSTNGSYMYPGEWFNLTLPWQSLKPFNFTARSGSWGGAMWDGPYWGAQPEPKAGGPIPVYMLPFPEYSAVPITTRFEFAVGKGPTNAPLINNQTMPWSTFPYVPQFPLPVVRESIMLSSGVGFAPLESWPMVPKAALASGDYSDKTKPWFTYPLTSMKPNMTEPGTIEIGTPEPPSPCPTAPSSGTVQITGSAVTVVDKNTNVRIGAGSVSAQVLGVAFDCPAVAKTLYFWAVDGNSDLLKGGSLVALAGETNTTESNFPIRNPWALSNGLHRVNVRVVFLGAKDIVLGSFSTAQFFTILPPVPVARMATQNQTVTSILPLRLDASTSIDGIDPCYFTQFISADAYERCLGLNPGVDVPNPPNITLVGFSCKVANGSACLIPKLGQNTELRALWTGEAKTNATKQAFAIERSGPYGFLITTDRPSFTIPLGTLEDGSYIWRSTIFRQQYADADLSPAVNITVKTTTYYLTLSSVKLDSTSSVFIGNTKVPITSTVVSNSVVPLQYTWVVRTSAGAAVPAAALADDKAGGLSVTTDTLADGLYTASLTVADTHSNVAQSSVTFRVLKTLPALTGCSVNPLQGVELQQSFTAACNDTLLNGAQLYLTYVVGSSNSETIIAYPASTPSYFKLPVGLITVFAGQYIPGTFFKSIEQRLPVNVTSQVVEAKDVGSKYADYFSSPDTSVTKAAMDSFTAKLASLDTDQKTAATSAVVEAITANIDVTKETGASAGSKTESLAKMVATGAINNESKTKTAQAVTDLTEVLAKFGAPLATLQSATAAAVGSVVAGSSTAGAQVVTALRNVARALVLSLSPGQAQVIQVTGSRLDVAAATGTTVPRRLGPATTSLLRRQTGASYGVDLGAAVTETIQRMTGYVPSGRVALSSNFLSSPPYPISSLNAGTKILSPAAVTIGGTVTLENGITVNIPTPLAGNISVTIPTSYTDALRKRTLFSRAVPDYFAECIVYGTNGWTTDGCTAKDTTTGGTSTVCQCTTLGTVSVQIRQQNNTVIPTPTPTPDPGPMEEEDDDGLSGGAIAGAVIGSIAGAAIIAGAAFWFIKKR